MSDPHASNQTRPGGDPEDANSARFAHLVIQQSSMAMMLLGKTPHPETGQVVCDLEAAKFFIDQLEMLEDKTKGNLNTEEAALLKQSLMSLRMAFVESVDLPPAPPQSRSEPASPTNPASPPAAPAPSAPAEEDAGRKKFTKKY
jgi:Domain of unknown function (DUF1844)